MIHTYIHTYVARTSTIYDDLRLTPLAGSHPRATIIHPISPLLFPFYNTSDFGRLPLLSPLFTLYAILSYNDNRARETDRPRTRSSAASIRRIEFVPDTIIRQTTSRRRFVTSTVHTRLPSSTAVVPRVYVSLLWLSFLFSLLATPYLLHATFPIYSDQV